MSIIIRETSTGISPRSAADRTRESRYQEATEWPPILETRDLTVRFGAHIAIRRVSLAFRPASVNAIIGPSGSGKSTLLRALNRMHDGIPTARVEGDVLLDGRSTYAPAVDPVEIRRRVGMVFQRPNPFAKSIFDNVAFGLRGSRMSRSEREARVEDALRRAGLWDEVKDRLGRQALRLSGGQQQRLCIARALAVEPDVLLMDEPSSALDPVATLRLEELMRELAAGLCVVVVTHSLEQSARVSDRTAVMSGGELIEAGPTADVFTRPVDRRTLDYISGRGSH